MYTIKMVQPIEHKIMIIEEDNLTSKCCFNKCMGIIEKIEIKRILQNTSLKYCFIDKFIKCFENIMRDS